MRHDHLLRSIAIGLSLAFLPAAHAAKPGPTPVAKKASVQKIVKPSKAALNAARTNLQTQMEVANLVNGRPNAQGFQLLVDHQNTLDPRKSVTVLQKGKATLSYSAGILQIQQGSGKPRRAERSDLLELGIRSQADFQRVIDDRIDQVARGITGVKSADPSEVLRKDIHATQALVDSVRFDDRLNRLVFYRNLRIEQGLAVKEPIILATGKRGSLVFDGGAIRWRDPQNSMRYPVRAELESVGIRNSEDFGRVVTAQLFKVAGLKGKPGTDALDRVSTVYDRENRDMYVLKSLINNPVGNTDLALVANHRRMLQDERLIVLAQGKGERLAFLPRGGLSVVRGGEARLATVTDLRRFNIPDTATLNVLASHVLIQEGTPKKDQ